MTTISYSRPIDTTVRIETNGASLEADWTIPIHPRGVVIFVQGCGSSRFSRRSRAVARNLYDQGLATLLPDLFTADEEREDMLTAALRFDVNTLVERVLAVTRWLNDEPEASDLPVGYFATGIGSAAALLVAAEKKDRISAIVSYAGRPDLAGTALNKVYAPSLLMVGSSDKETLALNRWAYWRMECERHLEVLPELSGGLEQGRFHEAATRLAAEWFDLHLFGYNSDLLKQPTRYGPLR